MIPLILHSLLFFVAILALVWLSRRHAAKPLLEENDLLRKEISHAINRNDVWVRATSDAKREISRLEQNVKVLAAANDDLCARHLLAGLANRRLQNEVNARRGDARRLCYAYIQLLRERNVIAEELAKCKPKGSRRTASECIRG